MGWIAEEAPGHEGYVAYRTRDGRTTGTSTGYGVLLDLPESEKTVKAAYAEGRMVRTDDMYELVPWDDVVGWRVQCECGWTGSTWNRDTTLPADESRFAGAESAYLPDGTTVDDAACREWEVHVTPARHSADIQAAAGEVARARAALDEAVEKARRADLTWQAIGEAAGITKQAAYERWSGR